MQAYRLKYTRCLSISMLLALLSLTPKSVTPKTLQPTIHFHTSGYIKVAITDHLLGKFNNKSDIELNRNEVLIIPLKTKNSTKNKQSNAPKKIYYSLSYSPLSIHRYSANFRLTAEYVLNSNQKKTKKVVLHEGTILGHFGVISNYAYVLKKTSSIDHESSLEIDIKLIKQYNRLNPI